MVEKYTLTNLTDKSVSVLKQKFTGDTGEQLGSNHRRAYVNSEKGREKVKDELPSPQQDAILQVWGDEPKVFPEEEE